MRSLAGALALALLPAAILTQPGDAPVRATTIGALVTYPIFFHSQQVRVIGHVVTADEAHWLASGQFRVLVVVDRGTRAADSETLDVAGTFWDAGRLEPGDPRLAAHGIEAIAQRVLNRPWPGAGDLLVIVARSAERATPPQAPTVRTIALFPTRYVDQDVTVVGRFRGRNLYGDLPTSPGQGRWDFVLQLADAAVWVTGIQPRGDGFNLNPSVRMDTGRWLEVSGIVRHARGLTWIEARNIRQASPPEETASTPPPVAPAPPPPRPEAIFSAPTEGEIDVAADAVVRIQFSRDMDPASFKGQVRVAYVGTDPAGAPVRFTTEYRAGTRALEIQFEQPLERFRTVRIELGEGITAFDATPLEPFVLTFSVG